MQPFYDLISAFKQNIIVRRYASYEDLIDYCRRSTNHIGRLMLCQDQADDARNVEQSDAISTSLQLINFWQDVRVDWHKGRIYLPQEDLDAYQISEAPHDRAS